jgi:VWFA-related protein
VYAIVSEKGVSGPIPASPQLVVLVDKEPAQIASLRSANEEKMLFALLVDSSLSDAKKAALIRHIASELFQRLSEGGNEGYLVVFNDPVATSKRTLQPQEVQQALDSVKFGGATALYDAIAGTCTTILSESRNPGATRRAIFLITDGEDTASSITREKAEEAAEREGVPIFSLQIGSAGMGDAEKRHARQFLEDAGSHTGGQAIQAKDLEEGIQLVISAVHQQWAIRLVPAQVFDQKMHSLAITSGDKSVKISAPKQISLQ